ncbi:TPA: hypothetical protein N2R62_004136 [Escherichia coli]|nr:hypothetical protein [Shigella boydii]EIH7502458.1 hypothetical protein [Escherichia coli]HAJ0322220.1 hypothetical protein [Escherichia coli]HCL6887387.1 hypothetical protein [Escherichia coli]HEC0445616.1 hypothetical protein [Escherichia coli]
MTTITKERIELFIKNPLENGLTRGEQMELARIALASLEADPVKRVNSDQMRRVCLEANRHLDKYDAMAKEVNKLLGRIAPPAPVVPEEATPENVEMLSGYVSTYKLTDSERDIAAEIWNACRTAMLQSGNFRESDVITPDHHKQAEKSGLERCHLETALNIKPGHTLGIIDALLVHKMARALLPLVAEKHEADHANES